MKSGKRSISSTVKGAEPRKESQGWTLPSGKRLEEFAEQGGYLAPLLLMTSNFPSLKDWNLKDWTKKRD